MFVASTQLTDDEFLTAFASCELPESSFHHGDHLRLAWLLLHGMPFDEALVQIRNGIQRYATHLGKPDLFHETITTAWVKLLATHHERTFAEFLTINERRLNPALLHRFWTPAVLYSEAAKSHWVAPDKTALPRVEKALAETPGPLLSDFVKSGLWPAPQINVCGAWTCAFQARCPGGGRTRLTAACPNFRSTKSTKLL